jgi:hypothetical protein
MSLARGLSVLDLCMDVGGILLASGFGLPFKVTNCTGEGNLLLQFYPGHVMCVR